MNYLSENIFSQPFTEAFGLTIMHSLWQGAVIALLLAFVLFLLRKASSNLRYWISFGALVLFGIASTTTFLLEYQASEKRYAVSTILEENTEQLQQAVFGLLNQNVTELKGTELSEWQSILLETASYFQSHSPLIVTCWALGILLAFAQIGWRIYFCPKNEILQNSPARICLECENE